MSANTKAFWTGFFGLFAGEGLFGDFRPDTPTRMFKPDKKVFVDPHVAELYRRPESVQELHVPGTVLVIQADPGVLSHIEDAIKVRAAVQQAVNSLGYGKIAVTISMPEDAERHQAH
jgi:hypothetical protein